MAATNPRLGDWDWDDPDSLADRMDSITEQLAHCQAVTPTETTEPYTKGTLVALGITGIEFAAFHTAHPTGLATDIVAVRAAAATAEPGRLFRVNGTGYFVQLDIGEPLPFESGCVDWVYAEHLIEHVSVPVAIGWLREVRRVLAPGGLLRLTTPDLRRYVEGYGEGDRFFANQRRRVRMTGLGPPMPERKAFMFNQIFYLYGHRWIYDFDELRYVLAEAGFGPATVQQRGFRDGARPDVAGLDRVIRKDETIYVEVTA